MIKTTSEQDSWVWGVRMVADLVQVRSYVALSMTKKLHVGDGSMGDS